MKYFIDFEFIEGDIPVKIFGLNIPKWLVKPNNTIQPISIGLVGSDSREYYAISKDFNLKEAWNRFQWNQSILQQSGEFIKEYWIRENVLLPIYEDKVHGDMRNHVPFTYSNMKGIIKGFGKTNKQIAEEVKDFVGYKDYASYPLMSGNFNEIVTHEFYGYYCDYDWVCFSWLFGKMIDLPTGFPMYCIDLKQEMDRKATLKSPNHSYKEQIDWIKAIDGYPKQTNEHNALADAKFNYDLYNFLITT